MRGVIADIDVLVVGLGPAGARAAWGATRAGRSVIAIDRRKQAGIPVQCAEFVPALLGQELDGLDSVILQRIQSMVTFIESEAPDTKGDFPGCMIDRARFDAMLAEEARVAGVDCRFGVALERLADDGAATLADGTTIRPRLIVGADGPRSLVGRAIGHVNRDLVETRQVTVPLLEPHAATDIFLAADIPGGYAWLFPKGDIANLGVGVEPSVRRRLKPLLDRLHRQLAADGRVGSDVLGHTGGPIPVGGMLDAKGRLDTVPVLLAGDAAGLTNPVTGAGIAAAVISGTLAGEAAAAWLAGNTTALDDYSDELRAVFEGALVRALKRRKELLARYQDARGPTPLELRRGWIAYDEYWAA
jgi:geranylgeranyl reductase family protein